MSITLTPGRAQLALALGRLSASDGSLQQQHDRDAVMPGGDHTRERRGGVPAKVLRRKFAASRGRRVPRRSTGS